MQRKEGLLILTVLAAEAFLAAKSWQAEAKAVGHFIVGQMTEKVFNPLARNLFRHFS